MGENDEGTIFGYPVVFSDDTPKQAEEVPVLTDWRQWTKAAEALDDMADAAGIKNLAAFQNGIRQAIRGLWKGQIGRFAFFDSMFSSLTNGYTRAWRQGARECGVQFDELTPGEVQTLQVRIAEQTPFIGNLADVIVTNSQAAGGKLGPLLRRGDIWVNGYRRIQQEAKTMACNDKKLVWELGPAEHCASCLRLSGQVRRGSFWEERGILPRVPGASYLDCNGYRCQCSLTPTDKPSSRGPLPRLP